MNAIWEIIEAAGIDHDSEHFVIMPFACGEKEKRIHVIGDWNKFPDLGRAIEAAGAEIVFDDDHTECAGCGGCIETEPSWFGWTPNFLRTHDGVICDECATSEWSEYLPSTGGKCYIDVERLAINDRGDGLFLYDLPEDYDYDAVSGIIEDNAALVTKAAHGDEEALKTLREAIEKAADPLPPMPEKVDDAEPWQVELIERVIAADAGWRAFTWSIDFDPECGWGADEDDDRTDREREREAREWPWHACMSMPGCLDTSAHVRGKTSKEALHALVGAIMEWAPVECSEAAYTACEVAE